jgi:cyclopropane fatty-acyl-phospholipid synthase-like methyltransferase
MEHIINSLDLNPSDIVLDLCCGNGLITQMLSEKCKSVTAIDISEELINQIDVEKYQNIETMVSDIRDVEFEKDAFSKIIIYAGIQYLSYKETILLFRAVFKWLQTNGIVYIGDIPDINRIWRFYNNTERESIYFNSIVDETPIVGTWYSQDFLKKMAQYCGFKNVKIIHQHKDMIYSHFRFDMHIRK